MQRLPVFEHDVVGDIDNVIDRALPRGDEPFLQPRRRLLYFYAGNQAGAVPRAKLAVGDFDIYLLLYGVAGLFIAD